MPRMYGPIGLRRRSSAERISAALKQAYELLFRSGHRVSEAVKLARKPSARVRTCCRSPSSCKGSKRGICRSVGKGQEDEEE